MNAKVIISRLDAAAKNLKKYYTGLPCKHGHLAPRWVCNTACEDCANPRLKAPAGAPASGLSHALVWALPRLQINQALTPEQQASIFAKLQGWLDHCTEEFGVPSARQLGHKS